MFYSLEKISAGRMIPQTTQFRHVADQNVEAGEKSHPREPPARDTRKAESLPLNQRDEQGTTVRFCSHLKEMQQNPQLQ